MKKLLFILMFGLFFITNLYASYERISVKDNVGNIIIEPNSGGHIELSPKALITPEGGIAVKLINKTGMPTIKGYIAETSTWVANAVDIMEIDEPDPIGIFYEADIADGELTWVIVSGIADVYYSTNTVLHYFARVPITGDLGAGNGKAFAEVVPSSPFATDKHFQEIGHVLESREGEGLAKTVLHFN